MDANTAKSFNFKKFKNTVVLIPYWIHEILMRNSLPIDKCMDLNSLKPLVSLNDLACFCGLNSRNKLALLLNGSVDKSNTELNGCVNPYLLVEGIYKPTPENYEFFINNLMPYSMDESINTELNNRLFSIESKLDNYDEPYKVYDLSNGTCGVVIYPGIGDRINSKEVQKSLVDSILKVFYVYSTSDDVASSAIFYRYLELLEKK